MSKMLKYERIKKRADKKRPRTVKQVIQELKNFPANAFVMNLELLFPDSSGYRSWWKEPKDGRP